jgi:trimeric autotransporter adhesin
VLQVVLLAQAAMA